MFEIHGWAVITSDTYSSDDQADARILAALEAQIAHIAAPAGLVSIHLDKFLNGQMSTLTVTGLRNHPDQSLLDLFHWIAEHSVGSYGVVYVGDDEQDSEYAFRVWRLARGEFQEYADTILSPRVPVIEDPYDPVRDE